MTAAPLLLILLSPLAALGQRVGSAPIVWWSDTRAGKTTEHAGLLLEVQLDGSKRPALMQLDTGTYASLVYEASYGQYGGLPVQEGRKPLELSGSVGGARFERERFQVRPNGLLQSIVYRLQNWRNRSPLLIGTIGLDFFVNRVLVLDFVGQRVAILPPGEELPKGIAGRVEFTPMEVRDYKVLLPVQFNDATYHGFLYDTGASAMPLLVTQQRWAAWTGSTPENPKNDVIVANSWGQTARLIGAPARGSVCVRGVCAPAPLVYYEANGLKNLDLGASSFAGVIGNALFDRRFTIVIDVARKRFGLVAGSLLSLQ